MLIGVVPASGARLFSIMCMTESVGGIGSGIDTNAVADMADGLLGFFGLGGLGIFGLGLMPGLGVDAALRVGSFCR